MLGKARPDLLLADDSARARPRLQAHRAFAPLEKWLKAGQLGFIPAVSDPRLSRSHFQAQDACNLGGLPGETGGRGFLDSLVGMLGKGTAFRSVGIGSTLPRSLVGNNGALVAEQRRLAEPQRRRRSTRPPPRRRSGPVHRHQPPGGGVGPGRAGCAGHRPAARRQAVHAGRRREYDGVGNAFKQLAQLIKGGANVRVATVGMGGYDTHENEGTRDGGYLFGRLTNWPGAWPRSSPTSVTRAADVTVMVSSEFGRRVAQNGGGTDHGHGGVVTVLSGRKLAGSLLGTWNGLDKLDNGDVPEYNNLFDVYGSVAKGRFGLTDAEVEKIFPRMKYAPMKLYA